MPENVNDHLFKAYRMKKILIAVADTPLSNTTLDFACYLARLTKSHLTAAFIESTRAADESSATFIRKATGIVDAPGYFLNENVMESRTHQPMMEQFHTACTIRETVGLVQCDRELTWEELIQQSAFADCIIADASFTRDSTRQESTPTHDTKKLLHEAKCPVIIAPLTFREIGDIVFAYDNSASSVYALRQFITLFPELSNRHLDILTVKEIESDLEPENNSINDWIHNYFRDTKFIVMDGDPESKLLEYMMSHDNCFIIMGGYGRSRFSRLLQPSTSATIVKMVASPVFIAHQ